MKLLSYKKFILILIVLFIIDVSLSSYIGFWREKFWSSVQNRELHHFIIYLSEFSIVAIVGCFVSGYSQYITNLLTLDIRTKLTRKGIKTGYYKDIEGGHQRIQEDCYVYPQLLVGLIGGLLRSFVMICVFSFIIIKQLGFVYLIIPLIYSFIGTLIAGKIAVPLINLNYINQVVETKFRSMLQIQQQLKTSYKNAHRNNYNLFKYTKYLQYFQTFYNQITIIVPYIILSIVYFSARITFGVFMQVASAMAEVINNLSYLINSFDVINKWLSCRKRLKEVNII